MQLTNKFIIVLIFNLEVVSIKTELNSSGGKGFMQLYSFCIFGSSHLIKPFTMHMHHNINLISSKCSKKSYIALLLLTYVTAVNAMSLHEAAKTGDIPTILACLNAGVNVDLQVANFHYWTPLYCAIMHGQKEAARCLLMHGAAAQKRIRMKDPKTKGKYSTALHEAALLGDADTVNVLLDYHAYVDQEDDGKTTPLFYAILYHHKEAIQALIDHGANVRHKNKCGNEPIWMVDLAVRDGNEEIVKLVHKHIEIPEKPRILALAEALHPRLGQNSPANILPADGSIHRRIFRFLCGDDEYGWGGAYMDK